MDIAINRGVHRVSKQVWRQIFTFLASHLIAPKICRLENRSMALRLDEIAAAPKNFNPSARPLAMKINTREFGLNHHS